MQISKKENRQDAITTINDSASKQENTLNKFVNTSKSLFAQAILLAPPTAPFGRVLVSAVTKHNRGHADSGAAVYSALSIRCPLAKCDFIII